MDYEVKADALEASFESVVMAAERPVRALVLDAPYTSVADLAASMYRWLPARRLLRHHFDSISRLPAVRAPVLVLHGEADALIPPEHGRRVAAAAGLAAAAAALTAAAPRETGNGRSHDPRIVRPALQTRAASLGQQQGRCPARLP